MEICAIDPKIIMGTLGGIMGPITDDAAVIAAEKFLSYPPFSIIGISRDPKAAASATAEPLIPAKSILAITLT